MGKVLDRVKSMKDEVKFYKDFGEYDNALKKVMEALEILSSEHEKQQIILSAKGSGETNGAEQVEIKEYREKLRQELSDCYGIAGGLYRRLEDYENSAKMYRQGRKYEQDDSYNLVNSILIPILQEPEMLKQEETKKDIYDALKTVEEQVKDKRRNQWWAWADLGLLYLLVNDKSRAIDAYAKFKMTGARADDYMSTEGVLDTLRKRSLENNLPITASITEAIQYLNNNMPSGADRN